MSTEPTLTIRKPDTLIASVGTKIPQKSKDGFAKLLKGWRDRHNLTQTKAAAKLGLNIRTLQNWEIARTSPRGLLRSMLEAKFKK